MTRTKPKSAGAAAIAYADAQDTAFQTQVTAEVPERSDRISLTLLQRLIKLRRGETRSLLIPLEWDERDEEFFQLLVEMIWAPLYPFVEEGLKGLAQVLDIVVEALGCDGLDRGACEC